MSKIQTARMLVIGGALVALPLAAAAQTTTSTTSVPTTQLSQKYADFAGSQSNSTALVTGLRSGSSITLSSTGTSGTSSTVTITPPTGQMGYGNVNITLALAEALLAKQGIDDPTPQQLQAALTGGTVTTSSGTVQLSGILTLRAQGEGWGQIANSLGFKLGQVLRAARADVATGTPHTERSEQAERVAERTERPETAERPERVERPDMVERPERPERPEMPERPERPDH